MILNRANHDHECIICHTVIKKAESYLNKLNYHGRASKFCINCIRVEVFP